MSEGFGWSFYGFWIYAAAWVSGYFIWARRAAHKERRDEEELPEPKDP